MKNKCEICGQNKLFEVYKGPIRDGAYGGVRDFSIIYECEYCGVQRLREEDCIPDQYYETDQYRKILNQSLKSEKSKIEQDEMQHFTLKALFPNSLRGKRILDVGCGNGSLLDMLKNVSDSQVGIEPCSPYLELLNQQGFEAFASLSDAKKVNIKTVDYAFSIQVIEHVKNPVHFLKEIRELISSDGKLLISTPNRDDILMSLLHEEFYPFFYRTQHRWYFNEASLSICAKLAGFKINNVNFLHRYGMSNTFHWLKDKKPRGRQGMDGVDESIDQMWQSYLRNRKQSDNIYIEMSLIDD
jgi:2-polyprenyl-3-methyl-5-hydroxy-6-metoxy-1,4-benzoquinol methylase